MATLGKYNANTKNQQINLTKCSKTAWNMVKLTAYLRYIGLFHKNKHSPLGSNFLWGWCRHLYRSLRPRTVAVFNSHLQHKQDWCLREPEAHKNLTGLSYEHILWIVRHSRNTNVSVGALTKWVFCNNILIPFSPHSGRFLSTAQVSSTNPNFSRPYSTRHLAR